MNTHGLVQSLTDSSLSLMTHALMPHRLYSPHRTMKPYLLALCCILLVAGCSGMPEDSSSIPRDNEFIENSTSLAFLGLPKPKSVEDAVTQGDRALAEGDLNRSLFEYVRALDLDQKNTEIYLKIGMVHERMGNPSIAHRAYSQALKLEPDNIAALEKISVLLLKNNKVDRAKKYLVKAISLYQENARLVSVYQQALDEEKLAQKNNQTAHERREKTDKAVTAKPTPLEFPLSAYTSMGVIMDLEGKHAEALPYYLDALTHAPFSALINNNIGYSYYLIGYWEAAENYFSKAIEFNPQHQMTWKNLGLLYARQARYMESLNAFEQVMDKSKAYNDVGYICLINGRYDEAKMFLEKAIDLNPAYYPVAVENLAKVEWYKKLSEVAKTEIRDKGMKTKM